MRTAVPMLFAQMLHLLYNIVDRIYIGRIPEVGTLALGSVGLCFPFAVMMLAFTNLFGAGGAPLCAIERGKGNEEQAEKIMNTSFWMLVITALILTLTGEIFAKQLLFLFGASDVTIVYALPYLRIYLIGNLMSMISTGLNPYINAQGFARVGMITVFIGAITNIILDPVFIFKFGMGVSGAALATVLSQSLSAVYVVAFLRGKSTLLRLRPVKYRKIDFGLAGEITWLGTASFIMQFTNSLVAIVCNSILGQYGGDVSISVYTVVSSVRQILDTPVLAIAEGASPVVSFNYGAGAGERTKTAIRIVAIWCVAYTFVTWLLVLIVPEAFAGIFTDDANLIHLAAPALRIYFFAFIFQALQFSGQTTFKALNMKNRAIFFSIFRKVIMVVPLTILLPGIPGVGANGVFAAEPISNFIGGTACFVTMYLTVYRRLSLVSDKIV